jgi:hypothetical protein
MGSGSTSSSSLSALRAAAVSTNPASAGFAYSASASSVHQSLDPSKANAAGKKVRESVASADSPNPIPIATFLDVTGSMQDQPAIAADNLPGLYALIKEKGYVPNPHLLFGAVGDAYGDRAPLQVGQFEADERALDHLQNVWMEGGGGGGPGSLHSHESYELMLYYMAYHTELDCLKRGKKGYLMLCADELPYPVLKKHVVKEVLGETIEQDIPFETILAAVQKKFNFFYILPRSASHGEDPTVINFWKKKLGENFVRVDDLSSVSSVIAGLVALCEGADLDEVIEDITDVSGASVALSASTAIAPLAKGAIKKIGSAALPASGSGKGPSRL